ncbi:MAG: hypothetical protein WCK70_15465 [Chloroflexales bacterium]
MVDSEIKLSLPAHLAREAAERGLLTSAALQQLIDAEVERRRTIDRLFTTMDDLAAVDLPPLSAEELNAEITAARAERQARRAERMTYAEDRLREVAAARGLTWDDLDEDAREVFINDVLHEDHDGS